MINKQSIWFLTLFSLILVLSVYYITMPNELLITNNNTGNAKEKVKKTSKTDDNNEVATTISEEDVLTALRVESEEERDKEVDELNKVLNGNDSSSEDKNNAFERIKDLNSIKGMEQKLEKKIKDEFSLNSFVKIEDNNKIKIVTVKEEHDVNLASQIMKSIQDEYKDKMYISIKFQS